MQIKNVTPTIQEKPLNITEANQRVSKIISGYVPNASDLVTLNRQQHVSKNDYLTRKDIAFNKDTSIKEDEKKADIVNQVDKSINIKV